MSENSQQIDLLNRLLDFYKKRYSSNQSTLEDKFNDACEDLIKTGDIKKSVYIKFCIDSDIEPKTTIKTTIKATKSKSYDPDPCSRGYIRSHC